MLPQTLTDFREVWTVVGAVGVSAACYTTREAFRDRVAAIRRRDKRAAVALTRAHVESSRELLLEQIGELAVVP